VQSWATLLGVTSAILAAIQYAPQFIHTYRFKLVGALSIPMMCIQSPGAVLMILGIALRSVFNGSLSSVADYYQSWYRLDKLVYVSRCGDYAGFAACSMHFVEDPAA